MHGVGPIALSGARRLFRHGSDPRSNEQTAIAGPNGRVLYFHSFNDSALNLPVVHR